jgi:cold shock CspA family protein
MERKKGRVKFADPDKGYGYIIAEDAADASDTTLFDMKDVDAEIIEVRPGLEVEFEIEPDSEDLLHATNIRTSTP